MEKQIDMDIKVDRTEWGQLADDLIRIKQDIEKMKKAYKDTEKDLLVSMHKHNQSQIKIGGCTIKPKFVESKETIVIKKEV